MKRILLLMTLLTASKDIDGQSEKMNLQRVLLNLEQIKSASYTLTLPMYAPGEDTPSQAESFFVREFDNPMDTSIGASFGIFSPGDSVHLRWFYDGSVQGKVYWDRETVQVDDFSANPQPVRPVSPPFFNYARSIIHYTLTTTSAEVELIDLGDSLKLQLNIPDKIVEFFGSPQETKNPSALWPEKFSRYSIWISKNDYLPFRIKRVMPHQTSERVCKDVTLNQELGTNFVAIDYYPLSFAVEKLDRSRKKAPSNLIGMKAPAWILRDADDQPFRLEDIKSKVLLIQFTGIGCGPCQLAIPFLNSLATAYQNKDFELISIETWNTDEGVHNRYRDRYDLHYKFFMSNDSITNDYQVGGVPAFYLLDEHRKIVQVLTGYSKGRTDEQLRDLIDKML